MYYLYQYIWIKLKLKWKPNIKKKCKIICAEMFKKKRYFMFCMFNFIESVTSVYPIVDLFLAGRRLVGWSFGLSVIIFIQKVGKLHLYRSYRSSCLHYYHSFGASFKCSILCAVIMFAKLRDNSGGLDAVYVHADLCLMNKLPSATWWCYHSRNLIKDLSLDLYSIL